MTTGRKIGVGVILLAVLASAMVIGAGSRRGQGVEVSLAEITREDLVSTVTASGNIRARRTVDISSDVSARVAQLLVREGDDVEAGRVLVRLDPSQFEAARARASAALSQAQAQAAQSQANLLQAIREFDRIQALYGRDTLLVSTQQIEDAETKVEVGQANMDASRFGVEQARASLEEAEDRLDKTVIRAPMAGRVTRLNVEEGETVIIGTMNNPGSLVLTISDLTVAEAVVQVDETDVPDLTIGDHATVDIDAFPNRAFAGTIAEIGNSAIQPPSSQSGGQAAIDFEVVITLHDPPVQLRPDLSATAEIVTESRTAVTAVPIIAVTVRDRDEVDASLLPPPAESAGMGLADVEGVFVVRDGVVSFQPVIVGIVGAEHFEVLWGLDGGETVVAGPYQEIRRLRDGDRVRERESVGG